MKGNDKLDPRRLPPDFMFWWLERSLQREGVVPMVLSIALSAERRNSMGVNS